MDAIDRIFGGMHISATGLAAERARIDVIAQNIANAQTTRMPGTGGPYRRQVVYFAPILERETRAQGEAHGAVGQNRVAGVRVSKVIDDTTTPFDLVNDPSHPHANEEGVVTYPNVNVTMEMADLITAVRAYEANLSVQESFFQMAQRSLRLAD